MSDPHPFSGAWWASRTDEEIKEQLDGSFPGGPAYLGARDEMARRSGAKQERLIKWTLAVSVVAAIAAVATIFVGFI